MHNLHPDLERRYLEVLRTLGEGNQLILTTHSPQMMIAAGSDALYTVLKDPPESGSNQLVRVTQTQELHDALAELMGSRGIVSINQRVVFIEGGDASADREIYEAAYPPAEHNVAFVPAGNSAVVRQTAEKVNCLLSASLGFQHYFSIVDGDVHRLESDPSEGTRLFRLPVYHVENLLLDDDAILEAMRSVMGVKCPYRTASEVEQDLKDLVLDEGHLKPYARALFDAEMAKAAKDAYDAVYKHDGDASDARQVPTFEAVEAKARAALTAALHDGTWRARAKGKELLRHFCGKHGLRYEHFRNLLISRIRRPHEALSKIMERILAASS